MIFLIRTGKRPVFWWKHLIWLVTLARGEQKASCKFLIFLWCSLIFVENNKFMLGKYIFSTSFFFRSVYIFSPFCLCTHGFGGLIIQRQFTEKWFDEKHQRWFSTLGIILRIDTKEVERTIPTAAGYLG